MWLLAGAAVLWVCAVVAAPWLPVPISAAVYALGSFICHQKPERSFVVDGFQLPVCARCVGIYAGAATGALVALHHGWRQSGAGLDRTPFQLTVHGHRAGGRTLIALSVLPALLSLVIEWTGLGQPGNVARAITGVMGGGVIAAVVLATLHYEQCAPPRPIAPSRPPTPT